MEENIQNENVTLSTVTVEPENPNHADLDLAVDNAFSTTLASVIMAWFPVASILAIFKGKKGLNYVKEVDTLAEKYGCESGGKRIASKIMGMIGFIAGIAMTAMYALYAMIYMLYLLIMIICEVF